MGVRRYRRLVRHRWHLLVAVSFIRVVHNVDKLVRIEPGGFGVPAGARRVPEMSGAPILPEVVAQLMA